MKRRTFLTSAGAAGALGTAIAPAAARQAPGVPAVQTLANGTFRIEIEPSSGSIVSISHPRDSARMSWVSGPANAPWQGRSVQWGLGYADLGKALMHRGRWETPVECSVDAARRQARSVYRAGALEVTVTRTLGDDALEERYRFTNRGGDNLPMGGARGALVIATPFNDHYTSSSDVMEHRCHAHVWANGTSSWVAMLRMGGRAPHLGLVLNEGALAGYSIVGRDDVTSSNTRGSFLLHPDIGDLQPGASREIAWTLFWHDGWDDFFAQCARRSQAFVRIGASRYTAYPGETVQVSLQGRVPDGARLTSGHADLPLKRAGNAWESEFRADALGERVLELATPDGARAPLVLNVVAPLDDLIAARLAFIVARQQVDAADDPANGAFVVYDNETEAQVRHDKVAASDRNDGRERIGMGVLLARWLRAHPAADPALTAALRRYMVYASTRLQRPDGFVMNGSNSATMRLYNWPWMAQLHLEYARLTGEEASWQAFIRTIDSFYSLGGEKYYAIGMPVYEGLTALKRAGRTADHARLLALFERHGRHMADTGAHYPDMEVNYEQSIVAPAAVFLLELHRATGDARWLAAAKPHLALLELFGGRQPDHHLHDIAIRHWDGYWFGKRLLWGDTFPHYWSTLTAVAFHHYARSGGGATYADRAEGILRNNLSLFTPDGRGSAAHIYPLSVNGRHARVNDPYANDQDWALVHALQIRETA
jgi:hypothetical protein